LDVGHFQVANCTSFLRIVLSVLVSKSVTCKGITTIPAIGVPLDGFTNDIAACSLSNGAVNVLLGREGLDLLIVDYNAQI